MQTHPTSIIYAPSNQQIESSNLFHFLKWINSKHKIQLNGYDALWEWSVSNIDIFWQDIIDYFKIKYKGEYQRIMSSAQMPGVRWFEGIELNYAEHLVRDKPLQDVSMIVCNESSIPREIQWNEILSQAAILQKYLQAHGLQSGDRMVAYIPAIPEASIALLASASSGFVWSSCSPDFGSASVINRFKQIEPRVMIAVDGYIYGGKKHDRKQDLKEIISEVKTLEFVILIDSAEDIPTFEETGLPLIRWSEIIAGSQIENLEFKSVPFDHPLWILYSSGTTGLPKAITHSHGGMLLEHSKYVSFHNNVKAGELFFWYTTTGWMMWNYLHATWLAGSVIVLYDGHPGYPDISNLWNLAAKLGVNHFGTSAPFIHASIKANVEIPSFPTLRSINSTGSPLNDEGYQWLYKSIPESFYLWSMSGGTDMCTAFVGGCPIKPIYLGEIQCIGLACDLRVLDDEGHDLFDEEGELVIASPMPCMPIYFWNDPFYEKYKASYFDAYPGKWRHGDWITLTPHHGLIISGRSDTTLKRYGVRIGTAEIYAAVDKMPGIIDSLIIHVDSDKGEPYMPLFIKLNLGEKINEYSIHQINMLIRTHCSPRHVPDDIFQVDDIPYTLSGKKMEAPVKKLFKGISLQELIKRGVISGMRNPESMTEYEIMARHWLSESK